MKRLSSEERMTPFERFVSAILRVSQAEVDEVAEREKEVKTPQKVGRKAKPKPSLACLEVEFASQYVERRGQYMGNRYDTLFLIHIIKAGVSTIHPARETLDLIVRIRHILSAGQTSNAPAISGIDFKCVSYVFLNALWEKNPACMS